MLFTKQKSKVFQRPGLYGNTLKRHVSFHVLSESRPSLFAKNSRIKNFSADSKRIRALICSESPAFLLGIGKTLLTFLVLESPQTAILQVVVYKALVLGWVIIG